jgi:hypothetical protein
MPSTTMSTRRIEAVPPKSKLKWIYSPFPEEIIQEIDRIVEADKKPLGHWNSRADFMITFMNLILNNYYVFLKFTENKAAFQQTVAAFQKQITEQK